MLFRERAAVVLVVLTTLAASGCIDGKSRDIPPGPTAAPTPPPAAAVFVYVAQARDPQIGVNGGAVSVYQLGADGLLPAQPNATVSAVNPRRLVRHPDPNVPVLYVATANQVLAFDISGGGLVSLCPGGGLAPPCATEARPGSNPVDIKFRPRTDGSNTYTMYVVEQGNGSNLETPTRLSAFSLNAQGGIATFQATSQAQLSNAVSYQGAEVTVEYAYVGDVGQSNITRFPLEPGGNLPDVPPTPTPLFATPTPPEGTPMPTDSPTPSPAPTAFRAFAPGKIIKDESQDGSQEVLYVVQQSSRRIGANPIDGDGNLGKDPSSESNTRGIYNEILIGQFQPDPGSPPIRRIYGAALQNGQVDSFLLQADGNIVDNTLSATFANTASYPTGLALLPITLPDGTVTNTLFVSVGGFDRVDAYALNPDGTIPELPFTSTEPQNGTFPSDVAVYVAPVQ